MENNYNLEITKNTLCKLIKSRVVLNLYFGSKLNNTPSWSGANSVETPW